MKDPFAENEVHRYIYPAPFEKDSELIDAEVMKDVESGEDAPWIELRIPHSTGDLNAIADATQLVLSGSGDQQAMKAQIKAANRVVFALLCEGWSFARKPSSEAYEALGSWAGTWANQCLSDARNRGTSINPKVRTESSSSEPKPGPAGRRPAKRSGS